MTVQGKLTVKKLCNHACWSKDRVLAIADGKEVFDWGDLLAALNAHEIPHCDAVWLLIFFFVWTDNANLVTWIDLAETDWGHRVIEAYEDVQMDGDGAWDEGGEDYATDSAWNRTKLQLIAKGNE